MDAAMQNRPLLMDVIAHGMIDRQGGKARLFGLIIRLDHTKIIPGLVGFKGILAGKKPVHDIPDPRPFFLRPLIQHRHITRRLLLCDAAKARISIDLPARQFGVQGRIPSGFA